MKPYAHRDDYYIFALLTEGSAAVEIDFERKEFSAGDILIISPWQVHNKPATDVWDAGGWMLAFTPDILSESDIRMIEEYSISPQPFRPPADVTKDIDALCAMLKRHCDNRNIFIVLATAVKSIVLSTLYKPDKDASGRYRSITLKLKRLLDRHLATEKSPAAYASMLNLSEVYLNEAVKGATGLSIGNYIRSQAIVQARRQLARTTQTAKEIAYALGYDDYVYFSKLFKKNVGLSPTEYRKNLK